MKEKEILSNENIGECIGNQEVLSSLDFFKLNILELLQTKLSENENYICSLDDVEMVAENLLENDELYDMLDSFILEELENYKDIS